MVGTVSNDTDVTPRIINAFKYMYVADSMAMPVHWFYRRSDIYNYFPEGIQSFEEAPAQHPGSIMSLHSTQMGGRKKHSSNSATSIVGDVILKGKKHFWEQSNIHYHHGMKAGDTTLNAHCALWLLQSINSQHGEFDLNHFLRHYVEKMTCEIPQHNDTYAESYHRGFFANLQHNDDLQSCGAITHDTASIGGLVSIGPLVCILFLQGKSRHEILLESMKLLHSTHPDQGLKTICQYYVRLLLDLLLLPSHQDPLILFLECAHKSFSLDLSKLDFESTDDSHFIGLRFSSACYITDSWPSVLYLCCKYHKDPKAGILANCNLGGDNVHRGCVLGFLLGLIHSKKTASQMQDWFDQLIWSESIANELNRSIHLCKK